MKKSLSAVFLIMAIGLCGIFLIFHRNTPTPDYVSLNEAAITAIESADGADIPHLMGKALRTETERMEAARNHRDRMLLLFLSIYVCVFAAAILYHYLYVKRTILRPFQKLQDFAVRVASGDLDIPLEMDRKNRFGAFSESFDIMREQLAAARENERLANISKKELVASLSHDIKTPVSSIKVIAEVYQAKRSASTGNEGGSAFEAMSSIIQKADQIDLLISNMFAAVLEELAQLKVSPQEITSEELAEHIRASDFQKKVRPFALPECVVTADSLRFRQVMDNIIGNSYKYADTDIEVSGSFEGGSFTLIVRDFGPGVAPDELSLLCEKYYRAGNSEGKGGSGLGLYLSRYFVTQMGGTLSIESNEGLWVIIRLKI